MILFVICTFTISPVVTDTMLKCFRVKVATVFGKNYDFVEAQASKIISAGTFRFHTKYKGFAGSQR